MIFKKLTASFGRLDRETLELHEGLNVISRPNESGKSTWAAFLLTMLYGVDTSERASKANSLPAKTRYRPWNGQEMAGSMELSWQGRDVTLQRSAAGRTPMGAFRAFETESGAELDLPAECGKVLLGVERGVYQRSGFIGQSALALSADNALEARMQALVTAGDETVNAGKALRQLRDLKNRRRHNRTGLIPQAEGELAEVEAALADQALLGRETMSLQAQLDKLAAERGNAGRRLAAQQAREAAGRREQLERARTEWEKRERNLREKEQTVAGLPALEELETMLRDLDRASAAARALAEETAGLEAAPAAPPCPEAFAGLDADQVREQAEADAERLAALRPGGTVRLLIPALFALLALGLGIAGLLRSWTLAAAAGFAAGAAAVVITLLYWKRNRRIARERTLLLARYGAADGAAIRKLAADYREAMLLHAHQSETCRIRADALTARRAELETLQNELLTRAETVCPSAATLSEARDGVQRAVHLQKFYLAALREAQPAKARFEALREAVAGEPPGLAYTPEDAEGDPQETAARLRILDEDLRQIQSKLDLRRGRMEASGDPAALAAKKESLAGTLTALTQEYEALELAMEALTAANDEIQTRFSPRINELAGDYMARMTGGRYDRVLLSRTMDVTARETGDPVTRPLAALSAGTADQLYLAVRLAISSLLLPADAPLVLDDALASFDEERMASAMALLQHLAAERQIILFTCHDREEAWLKAHSH